MLLARKPINDKPKWPSAEDAKKELELQDLENPSQTIPIFAVFAPDCLGYPLDYRFKMTKDQAIIAILCKPCIELFKQLGITGKDFFPCECHTCKGKHRG